MGIVFEHKGKKAVFDMKKFCRLKDELTYIGRFANKETSKIIEGTIIQYNGKFYTNELPFVSGVSSVFLKDEGLVKTTVQLFETEEYVPEKCKPLSDCPICIDIWDVDLDNEAPIESYAFYEDQLDAAKEIVKNSKDVDIFFKGNEISREKFLAS